MHQELEYCLLIDQKALHMLYEMKEELEEKMENEQLVSYRAHDLLFL